MGYDKRDGEFEKKDGSWNIHFGEFDIAEQLEGICCQDRGCCQQ
jgi:hypothetical protein